MIKSNLKMKYNSIIPFISDTILNRKEQYIVHQCNCVSVESSVINKTIFDCFPKENIYKRHSLLITKPGEILVTKNIIHLFGQYYPGRPGKLEDTYELRLSWFKEGLEKIPDIKNIHSLAFPYNIGCESNIGIWDDYLNIIEEFKREHRYIKIRIYKLPIFFY